MPDTPFTGTAVIINGEDWAIYTRTTGDPHWTLTTSGTGNTDQVGPAARTLGVAFTSVTDYIQYNAGGTWQPTIDIIEPPTPRQRIEAEIINLRAEDQRHRDDVGYSGPLSESHYIDVADGMQRALDIFTANN